MNGTQEKGLQLARGLDSFIEGGVSCTDEPSALQTSPLDHPQPAPAEHKPEEQQQQKPRAKAPLVLSSHPPPPLRDRPKRVLPYEASRPAPGKQPRLSSAEGHPTDAMEDRFAWNQSRVAVLCPGATTTGEQLMGGGSAGNRGGHADDDDDLSDGVPYAALDRMDCGSNRGDRGQGSNRGDCGSNRGDDRAGRGIQPHDSRSRDPYDSRPRESRGRAPYDSRERGPHDSREGGAPRERQEQRPPARQEQRAEWPPQQQRQEQRHGERPQQRQDQRQDQRHDERPQQRQDQRQDQRHDERQDQWRDERPAQRQDQRRDVRQDQRQDERQRDERRDERQGQRRDERQDHRQDERQEQRQDQRRDERQDQRQGQRQDQRADQRQDQQPRRGEERHPAERRGPPLPSRFPSDDDPPNSLHVSANTQAKQLAESIMEACNGPDGPPALLCIGNPSINAAVKAIAIACKDGVWDILFQPAFRVESTIKPLIAFYLSKLPRAHAAPPPPPDPEGGGGGGEPAAAVAEGVRELSVASHSKIVAVAGAIAGKVREKVAVLLTAIGIDAVAVAVLAIGNARQFLEKDSVDLRVRCEFRHIQKKDLQLNALAFRILPEAF